MKTQKKLFIAAAIIIAIFIAAFLFLTKRGQTDIIVDASIPRINVTSPAFDNLGAIPDKYTGRGDDVSPPLGITGLTEDAISIAIIMDDLDVPWSANFNHWVIWNIPATESIPENFTNSGTVPELKGAVQGMGFGSNRYRGPMPPFGTHRYQFHVFVLNTMLDLESASRKDDLIGAMESHILQYGALTGWYPRISK